jgi:hypothetical protein
MLNRLLGPGCYKSLNRVPSLLFRDYFSLESFQSSRLFQPKKPENRLQVPNICSIPSAISPLEEQVILIVKPALILRSSPHHVEPICYALAKTEQIVVSGKLAHQ